MSQKGPTPVAFAGAVLALMSASRTAAADDTGPPPLLLA
jgi:hypothetical protein